MEIRKEYNIQELINQLKEEVDRERQFKGVVILSSAMAQDILDVLQETYRKEQKHQTIESALISYEIETKKLVRTKGDSAEYKKELKESNLPDCFGSYEEEDAWNDDCEECKYIEKCATNNDTAPDCYGCYSDKDLDCNNCKSKESCIEDTTKSKEEEDDFV